MSLPNQNTAKLQVVNASITTSIKCFNYLNLITNSFSNFKAIGCNLNSFLLCLILLFGSHLAISQALDKTEVVKGGKQKVATKPTGGTNNETEIKLVNNTMDSMMDIRIELYRALGGIDSSKVSTNGKTGKYSNPSNPRKIHIKFDKAVKKDSTLKITIYTDNPNDSVIIIPTDALGADLMINTDLAANQNIGQTSVAKPTNITGGYQNVKFDASSFPSLYYVNETGQDIYDMRIDGPSNLLIDSVFINGKPVDSIYDAAGKKIKKLPAQKNEVHVFFKKIAKGDTVKVTVKFNGDATEYTLIPTNAENADIVTTIQNLHPGNEPEKKVPYEKTKAKKISSTFVNDTKQSICDMEFKAEKEISKIIVDSVEWPIVSKTNKGKNVKVDAPAIPDNCIAPGATYRVTIVYADGTTDTKTYTYGVTNNVHKNIDVVSCTGGSNTFLMPNENASFGLAGRSGSIVAINESCSPISQLVFSSPDSGIVVTNGSSTLPSTWNNTLKTITFNPPVLQGALINYSFTINHLLPYSPTDSFPYTTIQLFAPGSQPFDGIWWTTNPTCGTALNGAIDFTVSKGLGPFVFMWSNGSTTEDLENIGAGIYTVTVTSPTGCMMKTIELSVNVPMLKIIPLKPSCYGANDGEAIALVDGMVEPVNFVWTNAIQQSHITNLSPGNYGVIVNDAAGCVLAATTIISQTAPVSVTGTVAKLNCYKDKSGAINITANGGNNTYNYMWNNGSNKEDRTALSAGTYTVITSDGFGCSVSNSFVVKQPAALIANTTSVDVQCGGGSNGAAMVAVTGGTKPYHFAWSNGMTSASINSLSAGPYIVTVADAKGCDTSSAVIVNQPPPLVLTIIPIGPDQAFAQVFGGMPGYSYSWNTIPPQNTAIATGLLPGQIYTVTITDMNNCMQSATIAMGSTRMADANTVSVKAFPNPTSGILSLEIGNTNAEKYSIELFDATGQKVYSLNESINTANQFQLDITSYADGIYSLKVSFNNKIEMIKVVLQKNK